MKKQANPDISYYKLTKGCNRNYMFNSVQFEKYPQKNSCVLKSDTFFLNTEMPPIWVFEPYAKSQEYQITCTQVMLHTDTQTRFQVSVTETNTVQHIICVLVVNNNISISSVLVMRITLKYFPIN